MSVEDDETHEDERESPIQPETPVTSNEEDSSLHFTDEQEELFKRRFEEGYDLEDADYSCWLKYNHPESATDLENSSLASHFLHIEPQSAIQVLNEATSSCSKQMSSPNNIQTPLFSSSIPCSDTSISKSSPTQSVSSPNNIQTPLSSSLTPRSDTSMSKFLTSPHLSSPDTPSSVPRKSFPRAHLLTSAASLAEMEEKERKGRANWKRKRGRGKKGKKRRRRRKKK